MYTSQSLYPRWSLQDQENLATDYSLKFTDAEVQAMLQSGSTDIEYKYFVHNQVSLQSSLKILNKS